ncbi:BA75_02523T0 [Komagataella pastoris]|uniref:BA75_02523T0 n=1 Tax=Komagataella pastoris TaxID=4922 RepID=A0A1B2JCQ4_PICPA|nr:BA75_02523T0 [Komagataella pastoris]
MAPELPFNNLYKLRRVAADQARACFICYKPSDVVLVTVVSKEKPDFFYLCKSHLEDTQFCSKLYFESVGGDLQSREAQLNQLKIKKVELEKKLFKLEDDERKRQSALNKLYDMVTGDKKTKEKEKKDEDSSNEKDNEAQAKKNSILEIRKSLNDILQQIDDKSKEYLHYQLDSSFFRSRLKKYYEAVKSQQRLQFLSNESNFPSTKGLSKLAQQEDV